MEYKYIACSSFGKDSMATILTALQYKEPLDAVLYCEVMYDKEISGEVPEHKAFIHEKAIPWLERQDIRVFHVKTEITYLDVFYRTVYNSLNPMRNGRYEGFPLCGKCRVQSKCKGNTLKQYVNKNFGEDVIQYLGISADEKYRLKKLKPGQISLLEKYKLDKGRVLSMVQDADLLSPVYKFARRSGCWFCPNASLQELAHLRKYHTKLWERFLELGKENTVSKKFNRDYTLDELEQKLKNIE